MNCFRNLFIFAAETTRLLVSVHRHRLWIAFEICLYLQLKQLSDLHKIVEFVVNCFRNLFIFAAETTILRLVALSLLLWIAFEICLYLQLKQPAAALLVFAACCELLSKFVYICSWNNYMEHGDESGTVVNCFRNLFIFAAETTVLLHSLTFLMLWIAFEICLYLQLKQPCWNRT